ncbi:hypothetical protein [Levilactobacillus enshiensis]|uniref:hypothetical protein n=1 Tax=Levilactobacillus enshiensis TaxID=2590213 RepID=UPI00117BC786|nr:hypothetical protein [Levilactobacillus enshiensis]
MFKMGSKSAVLLMLLGAAAGSLAVTNASAKTSKKAMATSKKITSEFDKVGIRNLTRITRDSDSRTNAGKLQPDVFTVSKSLNLGNQYRNKGAKISKNSVVIGSVDSRGLASIKNTTLSKKNQKKVFSKIGKKWQYSISMNTVKPSILKSHTAKTAFAYGGYSNLPDLYRAGSNSSSQVSSKKFITVTADNYLNYYTNNTNYTKISQSIKIKKFNRGKSVYTYYLAKPLKGFGTKKVKVFGKTLYRLRMSLGDVFQAKDDKNGDADGFRIMVKVGNQKFYTNLGNIAESYADLLQGNNYGAYSFDEQKAKQYVQGLQ